MSDLTSPPSSADLFGADPIAHAANDFGLRLMRQIATTQSSNVIISPLSIWMALAMARNGAAGATRAAMTKVLGIESLPGQEIGTRATQLLKILDSVRGSADLTIANALWLASAVTVNPAFIAASGEIYRAEVRRLNFAGDPGGAAEVINQWVNDQTHGHITGIVDSLSPATIHFLTNAVYFAGDWAWPFDLKETNPSPFFVGKYLTETVDMMRKGGRFSYLETAQFQAIRLPYKGDQLEMCVILPRVSDYATGGPGLLAQLLGALDNEALKNWLNNPNSAYHPGTFCFPAANLLSPAYHSDSSA
jgi:serpin B